MRDAERTEESRVGKVGERLLGGSLDHAAQRSDASGAIAESATSGSVARLGYFGARSAVFPLCAGAGILVFGGRPSHGKIEREFHPVLLDVHPLFVAPR